MLRCVALWMIAMMLSVGAHAQQTVNLMANTSPPYADSQLPDEGLALELVRHIYSKTDFSPVITIENWSRAIEGARVGVYDGLASVWYSSERAKDLQFSKPYLRSDLLILKLRSNTGTYTRLEDLAGSRLGVRTDYAYGVDFSTIPNLKLVEEDLLVSNLLNLLSGKVDFVIADQRAAAMQLHDVFTDKITQFSVVDIELPAVERHVAASLSWPQHEEMITQFNRALAVEQKNGSLDAIIKKWDARYGGLNR